MKWINAREPELSGPGIYAIYLDGKLAYIGSSGVLKARVRCHALPLSTRCGMFKGKSFRIATIKIRPENCISQMLRLESALIARLKPLLNRRDNPLRHEFPKLPMTTINVQFRKFVNDFGGQSKVARLLKMSPGHVSLVYNGKRRVTVELAERIDIATRGQVSKESLIFPSRTAA